MSELLDQKLDTLLDQVKALATSVRELKDDIHNIRTDMSESAKEYASTRTEHDLRIRSLELDRLKNDDTHNQLYDLHRKSIEAAKDSQNEIKEKYIDPLRENMTQTRTIGVILGIIVPILVSWIMSKALK